MTNSAVNNDGVEPKIRFRDNPLMHAQMRRSVRPNQLGKILVIPFVLGTCALLFGGVKVGGRFTWFGAYIFILLAIGFTLLLRGTTRMSNLMAAESTSGILEFHQASPTTGFTDALGYLVGGAARSYVIAAMFTPFLFAAAVGAEVSILSTLVGLFLIILSATMYQLMGMLLGLAGSGRWSFTTAATVITVCMLIFARPISSLGVSVVGYLTPYPGLASLNMLGEKAINQMTNAHFFGLSISPVIYTILVQCFVIAFLFWAVSRKLKRTDTPGFSRMGAILFFSVFTVLMLSDLYADPTVHSFLPIRGQKGIALFLYLITSVVLATLILGVLTPRYLQFVRWSRRAESRNAGSASIWDDAARVWPTYTVFALIILAAFTLVSPRLSTLGADLGTFSEPVIRYLVQALGFVFFFVAASEYSSFVTGRSRLGTLGLILFLFIALPWVLFALFTIKMDASNAMYAAAISPTYGLAISSGLLLKPLPSITPFSQESIYLSMVVSFVAGGYFVLQTNKIIAQAKRSATQEKRTPEPKS